MKLNFFYTSFWHVVFKIDFNFKERQSCGKCALRQQFLKNDRYDDFWRGFLEDVVLN